MTDKEDFLREYRSRLGRVRFHTDEHGNITHVIKQISPELKPIYERLMDVHEPHLATILAVTEANGELLVHQEYIRGENMLQWDGRITDDILLDIAIDLSKALVAIHSLQPPIVHRDIKPANIIRRSSGGYVLVDFDAGRMVRSDAAGDTQVIGTVGYAAPEQFGLMQSDPRSDIFSLGASLYWLQNGAPVRSNSKHTGRLARIIKKCTQLNPHRRYQSAEQLLRALLRKKYRRKYARRSALIAALFVSVSALIAAAVQQYMTAPPTPYSACSCRYVITDALPFHDQVHFFHPGDAPVEVTLKAVGYMDDTLCTAQVHRTADMASIRNIRLGVKSTDGVIKIEQSGHITLAAQGVYAVDADIYFNDEPVQNVTETIVLTENPTPYSRCNCMLLEEENYIEFDRPLTLPADGSPLEVTLTPVPALDDHSCPTSEHCEIWQGKSTMLSHPTGAECGIRSDGTFYTDTPGTYRVRLDFFFGMWSTCCEQQFEVTAADA